MRTHHGALYCYDLRCVLLYFHDIHFFQYRAKMNTSDGRHVVWRRKFDNQYGYVIAMAIDPWCETWMTLASTNSKMMLWDLRYVHTRQSVRPHSFQIDVLSWDTPHGMKATRLWANPHSPHESPQIFAAFDELGDISVYNINNGAPQR